jgi:predicted transglutaminase-like cysteine proteinase
MMGRSSLILLTAVAIAWPQGCVVARSRTPLKGGPPPPIIESGPTLAPFQYVRFCLQYPNECRPNAGKSERIELTNASLGLLKRVNNGVNASIVPTAKNYGGNLEDRWTIAPGQGDCNDYAVTKRHELLKSGLPSSALRLSVTKTAAGIGHLVLVVATTKGDLVMDSLADEIQPWQTTEYRWLKIQSADDPRFWVEVRPPVAAPSFL